MKKKKIIIISSISVVVILISIITIILLSGNDTNKNNKTKDDLAIKYKKNITIEIGDKLPKAKDYISKGKIKDNRIVYKDKDNKKVNSKNLVVGEYIVYIDNKKASVLKIVDTKKPELLLKELTIKEDETYDVNSFIDSCIDNSKEECILEFKEEDMGTYKKADTYEITIIAKDSSDNIEEQSTKLIIEKNNTNNNDKNNNEEKNNSKPIVEDKKPANNNSNTNNNTNNSSNNTANNNNNSNNSNNNSNSNNNNNENKVEQQPTPVKEEYVYNVSIDSLIPKAEENMSKFRSVANEVLTYINRYREEVGSSPLTMDESLLKMAMIRAIDISYGKTFSHSRPDNTSFVSVVNYFNYNYFVLGENIAAGQRNAEQAATGWRNSEGHYNNMIEPSFTKTGIGVENYNGMYYWVQIFA